MYSVFIIHKCRLYFPYETHKDQRKMNIVQQDKARVPERTSLHSFNLLWLMWAVCGGFFITNFLLAVWLELLVKPVFEKPVDTSKVTLNN